jgi:CheY-like chemotaxis protein
MRPVHDVCALSYDAQGRCIRAMGTVSDVSELRGLQAELARAQKLESVGRLAGGIAHDFNNLLTGILANLSSARTRVTDPTAAESLTEAERAVDRAAELVRGLLAYSRRAPFRPVAVDVVATVRSVVRLLRPTLEPRIQIVVDAPPSVPAAWADPGQVEQALVNLALNARDAMPQGGSLRFGLDEVVSDAGRFVRIVVDDTGVGMTSEVRARVFEPFFTTKGVEKGSGLGLAVVDGIVRQHGGWIEVESEPGKGSRFVVYLPRSPEPIVVEAPRAPEVPKGGAERILIVDDERAIRNTARTGLQLFGYRVEVAADGLEALEALKKERFDLVVLDLTMPGMSGREAFQRMRALVPGMPVIVSSGYALEGAETLPGLAGFLAKPYRPDDLAKAVRGALDARVS